MLFLEKFRDPVLSRGLLARVINRAQKVREKLGRPAVFMEVCGTHTVAISRAGLRSILGEYMELRSGPGCPVCVTDYADIDRMVAFASLLGVTVGTFGDMMRVPGSRTSLERQRAAGADVRVFYSPRDAVAYAAEHPERQLVFLGVGFETTAPGVAAAIAEARGKGVKNFSVYSTHKVVPPAMRAIIADPEIRIDGFILPGHVSTIIGRRSFDFIATEYGLPAVVAGFETLDIIDAIYCLLGQILDGEARVENGYSRVVREEGNPRARAQMAEFFEVGDASWRGFGIIPQSGLNIRPAYRDFDAAARFQVTIEPPRLPRGCACGDLLKGKLTPGDCRLFGKVCTPAHPVGPCMVSSEGACAAYYQYERRQ
ncbi:hydrogenase formation protein HypD [Desulfofundulus thermosubterraneus]|uniref:Hydrogenase maturation protein HypD n=1 Tax=Desulfofundulus thermosubterraneus DSM 16057 TaxID=1121432 RepID=A0A1M6FB72_9FIRM|nr:hydrogenase formation protein HypD [Desulfofundulus thermosubterraneus]SHI94923.1 Hydrogenase maturation protein HypD [Desulfofundulus thermosubterraneus DSM 16057]